MFNDQTNWRNFFYDDNKEQLYEFWLWETEKNGTFYVFHNGEDYVLFKKKEKYLDYLKTLIFIGSYEYLTD